MGLDTLLLAAHLGHRNVQNTSRSQYAARQITDASPDDTDACARSTRIARLRIICPMALYRLHFVDHGGNVYATNHVDHQSDDAAIRAAHALDVPSIGAGFDLWDDKRLVSRHRN